MPLNRYHCTVQLYQTQWSMWSMRRDINKSTCLRENASRSTRITARMHKPRKKTLQSTCIRPNVVKKWTISNQRACLNEPHIVWSQPSLHERAPRAHTRTWSLPCRKAAPLQPSPSRSGPKCCVPGDRLYRFATDRVAEDLCAFSRRNAWASSAFLARI